MELTTRYSQEKVSIDKFYSFFLQMNKTIKLHTLFTRAGLQHVLSKMSEDSEIFSFILDLTEAFRCYLIDLNSTDVEDKFIKEISRKISFRLSDNDLKTSLLPLEFNENFTSSDDIEQTIKSNIWLLPLVLIRFTNFYTQSNTVKSN